MKKHFFKYSCFVAASLLLCFTIACDGDNNDDGNNGNDNPPAPVTTPFAGDARILYYNPTTQTLELNYNPSQNEMMFFKFGSVVGFWNDGGSWASNKIAYNPAGVSYSNYSSIPYSSSITISHTYSNVMAGKGDPCRLAGIKASEITASNYDNSTWRLPTRNENIDFVGAPTSWYNSSTPIISLSNRSAAYWGGHEGRNGGWFPIPGNRESTNSRTTRSNNLAGFLPAAGARDLNGGASIQIGSYGLYWSDSSYDANHAFQIFFDNSSIYPDFWSGGAGVVEKNSGMAVRCVPQE